MSDATADHLAWEARRRPRAGTAAILAGLLTLLGALVRILSLNDVPRPSFAESLGRAAEPGRLGTLRSLREPLYQYIDDHAVGLIASNVLAALGFVGTAVAVAYLARAVAARRTEMPAAVVYLPYIGGAILAVETLLLGIGTVQAAHDFLTGPRTVDAAQDLSSNGLLVTAQLLQLAGILAIGAAFVMISLNAMRVGLLTRFMGVLGIIVGVLSVLPLGGPVPVLQIFWLIALGAVILGFWPNGVPPAWRSGRAQPWPSSQQGRQARRAQVQRRGGGPAPEPVEEPVTVPSGSAQPGSRKRKRKRRQ